MNHLAQELRLLRHLRGLPLVVVLLVTLAIIATGSGLLRQNDNKRAIADLLEAETQLRNTLSDSLQRQADGVASKPGALGFSVLSEHVVLPLSPGAALAVGSSELLPAHYRFDAHAAYLQQGRGDIDNPLRLSVGSFDLSFVLVFVVPIMVIALCYDMVSKEKEHGVLALACAQGIDPQQFIIGKLLARGLAALVMVSMAIGMAFFILTLNGVRPEFGTILAWWAMSLLYTGFWFALAVLVNALNRDSATNGVILANLWLLLVVIVPAVIGLAATSLFPAPSRVALTTELREAATEAEARAAAVREQYFFDHPDASSTDLDQEIYFRAVAQSEAEISGSIEPALAAFGTQAEKQSALARLLKFLSPALLFQQSLNQLVGSDRDAYVAFRTAAYAHHERWREFFVQSMDAGRAMGPSDWAQLPRYTWMPANASVRARGTAPAAITLALLMLGLLGIARRQFKRYPVV
jgi:ABC-2 type transport system permease protein